MTDHGFPAAYPTSARMIRYAPPELQDNIQDRVIVFNTIKKHRPRCSFVIENSAFNAPPGARTLDTLIKSQVLYQLS